MGQTSSASTHRAEAEVMGQPQLYKKAVSNKQKEVLLHYSTHISREHYPVCLTGSNEIEHSHHFSIAFKWGNGGGARSCSYKRTQVLHFPRGNLALSDNQLEGRSELNMQASSIVTQVQVAWTF